MATLRDKFIGCLAGCHIGSAMGAVPEGMLWQQIEETYGYIDELLPYQRGKRNPIPWDCAPGMTEDGVERQRLMILAIHDKQGRVKATDVRDAWVRYMVPASFGTLAMPFEGVLYQMAKSGIPACDIGKYCDFSGLNSFARACHAIGLINAGNVKTAKEDILEVGQLYQTTNSRGLQWACVTGVAIAAGTIPDATVESVLQAIFDNCAPDVVQMLQTHLEATKDLTDIRQMREYFDGVFSGGGFRYAFAQAEEVVTKGVCIFAMTKGNTKEAILAGTNMGRDTDCITAIAAGISGALTGYESIPEKWFDQVDAATRINPYTCSHRTIVEFADCMYSAYQSRLKEEEAFVNQMIDA